jgi:hypothetical protein
MMVTREMAGGGGLALDVWKCVSSMYSEVDAQYRVAK